ncbi:amidohydrolase family protein [Pontimicrobium sp. IMCC45349]|uniref:amidohydrolase family protein n=1 Tax=Pontimicrobium sp. IMCC45349 TaxID=3391574 RepID=UPI0039A254B3
MKTIKRLLKIILTLLILIVLVLVVTIWIDSYKTNYLKINKNSIDSKDTYLITNINVIPMHKDTILKNNMVLIKDGIINRIADTIQIDNVEIIDGQNKFLTPGLIDMHVHIWDRYELGLYLSNGVTAVRNLWGMPMHLRIKKDANNGKIYAPIIITTGPKLTGPEFIGDDNLNLLNPEEAKEKIISYKERGYDLIKTYYGLDKEIFDAVIEQANKSDIDIVAHPSQKVPFSYHLNPQIKSIEHAEEIVQQALKFDLDTLKLKTIIDTISQSKHTSYSPTLIVFKNIHNMMLNDSILESEPVMYMNPLIKKVDSEMQFERWYDTKNNDSLAINRIEEQHKFHLKIVESLHKADVNIICGTDAGIGVTVPGFSIHNELQLYKEAGLSNYEVLRTATVNPSKTHSYFESLGTIEEGKVANLLVLDINPLEDLSALSKPSTIFIKGKKLNRDKLNSFNLRAKNRKNLIVSAIRYVGNLIIEK